MGRSVLLFPLACSALSLAFAPAPLPRPDRQREAERAAAAAKAVLALSQAVETYKLNNGEYPASLKALARSQPCGLGPLAGEKELTDPWGRPYVLDTSGARNKGHRADV